MKGLLRRLSVLPRRTRASTYSLRLAMPRLSDVAPETVASFATRESEKSPWQESAQASLREIALRHPHARIEACLHPESCSLVRLAMPPLPEKRRRVAVLGEIEPLVLGQVDGLAIAYGPRDADGGVAVAWAQQEELQQALSRMRTLGLNIAALYPAPFFLRVPQPGEMVSRVRDGWRQTRTGRDTGLVEYALTTGHPDAYTRTMPREVQEAASDWSGPSPSWSLPLEASGPRAGWDPRWAWAAAGMAAALLVWVGGLNLHAQRLADHGQAIQTHMRHRVQTVFPTLPVVVDPLQQARQQRDARLAGGGETDVDAPPDFSRLVRASAAHLNGLDGQVQALRYHDGRLSISLRGGTPPSAADAAAIAAQLRDIGLSVDAAPDGWVLLGADGANAKPGGGPAVAVPQTPQAARGQPGSDG